MLRIISLVLQFNYAFTFGYIPMDNIQIYKISEEYNCYFAEFESEIVFIDIFFISGRIEANAYEKILLKKYSPYQMEYEVKLGMRFDFIEVGFKHYCVHPLVTFFNGYDYPKIRYEGGREELYIKFSNK